MSIGMVYGKVKYSNGKKVLLMTSAGLGFEINYHKKLMVGHELELLTTQIFRENSQELFGHETVIDKLLFELLLSVKGIGPKLAHALVMQLGMKQLITSIANEDTTALKKVSGVGNKASQQIILDLRSKITAFIKDLNIQQDEDKSGQEQIDVKQITEKQKMISDAVEACVALGLNESLAYNKIQTAFNISPEIKTSEDLLYNVLKSM